jgi:hypothetical protein
MLIKCIDVLRGLDPFGMLFLQFYFWECQGEKGNGMTYRQLKTAFLEVIQDAQVRNVARR